MFSRKRIAGKSLVFFFILPLLVVCSSLAGYSSSGAGGGCDNVAAIFDLGMGARPMGMGGAFASLADDENAVFYNPAALAYLDRVGVTSLWSPQFGLIDYGGLGLAGKYFGLNMTILSSSLIQIPNEFSAPTGDNFTYLSSGGVVGFGLPLIDNLSFGARLKYYYSHLSIDSAGDGFGWSVEPALLAKGAGFRFGLIFENALSSDLRYGNSYKEEFNRAIRLGVSYRTMVTTNVSVVMLSDLESEFDDLINADLSFLKPYVGIEVWADSLGVRAGYNQSGVTIGSSIDLDFVRLDWAYIAYHTGIDGSHKVSLTYRF